jgi:hypothetical protein
MLCANIKTPGFALATGLALIFLSSPAQAYTIYTDLPSWQSALFNYIISTDTFSTTIPSAQSITLASSIISTNSGPITLPNSFNNNSVGILPAAGLYDNAVQAGAAATASNSITWAFPVPVIAFGADFIGAGSNRLSLGGDFDGTGLQTLTVNTALGGQNGFLGVIGTVPFSNVTFGNPLAQVDSFQIDNAYFAPLPVPGPLPVIGASVAFGWSRCLRRRLAVRRGKHTQQNL